MTNPELATHIRQLSLLERLELLDILTRSLRDELMPQAIHPSALTRIRGIAKSEGLQLTDEQLKADYTKYLMEKYS